MKVYVLSDFYNVVKEGLKRYPRVELVLVDAEVLRKACEKASVYTDKDVKDYVKRLTNIEPKKLDNVEFENSRIFIVIKNKTTNVYELRVFNI